MTATETGSPLRILLVNWQDRENPEAGGAEVHLHEIFGRLAARGHRVRAVVGGWGSGPARVSLDGIDVHRVGGRHSFPFVARGAVRQALADEGTDILIEDINKVPLYTPRWAGVPVIGLVPHLFGATAFREASWPLAAVVWASERLIPRAYRDTPFHVISGGTADDLVARGVDRDRISVIHPGIDHSTFNPLDPPSRDPAPTILYVGRLKRYKGIDVVVHAFARLVDRVPNLRLEIAGRGDDRERLERLVGRLGLTDRVRFPGYIPEGEKVRRLRRAWVAVYPSPKEGWGIVNVEAAACGTPVVASDSPGLRESVEDGVSGYLVPHGNVDAWAGVLERLVSSADAADSMTAGCVRHAARFSWDRAARETEAHIRSVLAWGSGAAGE